MPCEVEKQFIKPLSFLVEKRKARLS